MVFPHYYNPAKVGQMYTPDVTAAVAAGVAAGLPPAAADDARTLLILVDIQVDFIHTDGALSIPGAIEDTRRTIEWIYTHAGAISTIAASLDSHLPLQIFSPTWWTDASGSHPAPYTAITAADVQAGKWRPLYEQVWSRAYVEKLQMQARKDLMIWPFHTLIGTPGHTIVPPLYEAIAYHAAARQSQPHFLVKGSIPKTEHYSILEPEVKVDDDPMGGINRSFLDLIAGYDRIYITGQAKSHCLLETANSLMRYFSDQPQVIEKLRYIEDTTSSVAHPEIDFEGLAEEVLTGFKQQGLRFVRSTDPELA